MGSVREGPPLLLVLGGLPATGKSAVAERLTQQLLLAYVRIDTLEQAIVDFGGAGSHDEEVLRDAVKWGLGYAVGYASAGDLLSRGMDVVAECVNPMKITRDAWSAVADKTGARCVQVELVCSDADEHQQRALSRTVNIPNLILPTWEEILSREYEAWDSEHIVLDTAGRTVDASLKELQSKLVDAQDQAD